MNDQSPRSFSNPDVLEKVEDLANKVEGFIVGHGGKAEPKTTSENNELPPGRKAYVDFITKGLDLSDPKFEADCDIFNVKEIGKEKMLDSLKSLLNIYLRAREDIVSMVMNIPVNLVGTEDISCVLDEFISIMKNSLEETLVRDNILINFIKQPKQPGLNNREKFLSVVGFLLNKSLVDNKKFKAMKKDYVNAITTSGFDIEKETMSQLESWPLTTRINGFRNVLRRYLYGDTTLKGYSKKSKVLLNGYGSKYNQYLGPSGDEEEMERMIVRMMIDIKNKIKLDPWGSGDKKAEKILKKFVAKYVILDLRDIRLKPIKPEEVEVKDTKVPEKPIEISKGSIELRDKIRETFRQIKKSLKKGDQSEEGSKKAIIKGLLESAGIISVKHKELQHSLNINGEITNEVKKLVDYLYTQLDLSLSNVSILSVESKNDTYKDWKTLDEQVKQQEGIQPTVETQLGQAAEPEPLETVLQPEEKSEQEEEEVREVPVDADSGDLSSIAAGNDNDFTEDPTDVNSEPPANLPRQVKKVYSSQEDLRLKVKPSKKRRKTGKLFYKSWQDPKLLKLERSRTPRVGVLAEPPSNLPVEPSPKESSKESQADWAPINQPKVQHPEFDIDEYEKHVNRDAVFQDPNAESEYAKKERLQKEKNELIRKVLIELRALKMLATDDIFDNEQQRKSFLLATFKVKKQKFQEAGISAKDLVRFVKEKLYR